MELAKATIMDDASVPASQQLDITLLPHNNRKRSASDNGEYASDDDSDYCSDEDSDEDTEEGNEEDSDYCSDDEDSDEGSDEDGEEGDEKDGNDDSETSTQQLAIIRRKLKSKSKKFYGCDDISYYKSLDFKRQKLVDDVENEIMLTNNLAVPLRFKILESDMNIALKALAISKVDQLAMLDSSSSEYYKMSTWIENLCKLPICKHQKLPVSVDDGIEKISDFLDQTKKKLDDVVYGHREAKDQIVRLLAKWISNPKSKGLVIGIEGVHGIGKTSLVKDGICQVLGLPFGFITLGGMSDGSYVVGHSYTYEGSRWGKIADILMKVGCMNPVLYFDELDKISTTHHGDEIANLLIHLTDSSQNDKFQDKYFTDLDLDLSRCLIIFSYNNPDFVNPILKDRMTVIKANGYNNKDKIEIAKGYMLPKIYTEFGIGEQDIIFTDACIAHIISVTDEEQGVRNLKRSLEDIVSQVNLHRLLKKPIIDNKELGFPLTVSADIVDKFIKKPVSKLSHPMMYI